MSSSKRPAPGRICGLAQRKETPGRKGNLAQPRQCVREGAAETPLEPASRPRRGVPRSASSTPRPATRRPRPAARRACLRDRHVPAARYLCSAGLRSANDQAVSSFPANSPRRRRYSTAPATGEAAPGAGTAILGPRRHCPAAKARSGITISMEGGIRARRPARRRFAGRRRRRSAATPAACRPTCSAEAAPPPPRAPSSCRYRAQCGVLGRQGWGAKSAMAWSW